jgi:coenzyme F420-0:L-glutamate ligase/coenzyme F420-1:gamma-L-glutamate ligase
MELFGISTPIIKPGDNLVEIILTAMTQQGLIIRTNDIFVIAETVVAVGQNRIRELAKVTVTSHALELSEQYTLDASLAQLILDEADEILGGVPHVLLTIKDNTLMANAGIDRSNAPPGHVVLLPTKATDEAWRMKVELETQTGHELGIIISDSRTQPLRLGTVGLALAIAGIEPIKDFRGHPDLYGTPLRITRSAIADNLASAAQLLLGEANEQVPVVLIRGAPVTFTKKRIQPEAMTIARQECLYMTIFRDYSDSARI